MKALRTARPSVRTAAPAALVLGAAVLLSGCGAQQPGAAARRRRPGHPRRRRPAGGRRRSARCPGVQQKVTPADTLVSLILAPFVLDQAEKDGKGISEAQARAAVKEIKNPAPATLEFVRTSLAANAPERAGPRGRPGRGQQGQDHRQPPLRHARPQAAELTRAGAQLDEAGQPPRPPPTPRRPGRRGPAAVVAARLSLLALHPRASRRGCSRARRGRRSSRPGRSWAGTPTSRSCCAIEDAGVDAPPRSATCTPAELARLLVDRAAEARRRLGRLLRRRPRPHRRPRRRGQPPRRPARGRDAGRLLRRARRPGCSTSSP